METIIQIVNIIDKFVETPEEKKAAEVIRLKLLQQSDKWQAEINKIESTHRSIFIAGWRPAAGWICTFALSWSWIIAPIIETILHICNIQIEIPKIDTAQAFPLIMALLGMSTIRTYDKKNSLTR